ncbi:hypothetical protein LINPERHAP1_LOCUS7622 [Linum perenne]
MLKIATFFEEEFLNARGEQREGEAEEAEEAWSTEMSGASDLAIGKLERLESIEGEDECCSICLERMSLLLKVYQARLQARFPRELFGYVAMHLYLLPIVLILRFRMIFFF